MIPMCKQFNFSTIILDSAAARWSSVASTEKDIDTRLTKAWTAINRLSIIWKSDLTDKMKRSFFQAAVASILLYGCTTWSLTKRLEKKLYGNYKRMLREILNKSWRQHHTRHQLFGGARGVMVIVIGNGHGDTSSNPGRDWLHFT